MIGGAYFQTYFDKYYVCFVKLCQLYRLSISMMAKVLYISYIHADLIFMNKSETFNEIIGWYV